MNFFYQILNIFKEQPYLLLLVVLYIYLKKTSEKAAAYSRPGSKLRHQKPQEKTNLKRAPKEDASGIIFGLEGSEKGKAIFSPAQDEGHILTVGGSGQGKTSALLIPTLKSWCKANANNSSFVIDISGDINSKVDMPNKLIYDPTNPKSIPYNIFGNVDRLKTQKEKNKALAELALNIMPDDPEASEGGAYYTGEGRKILTAALIAFYYEGKDFVEICELINGNSWRNLLNIIDHTHNEVAIKYINGFEGIDDKLAANSKQTCDDSISLFATDEDLKANVRRPKEHEECFEASLIETHNCFITIPDQDLEYYQALTQILTAQCLSFFKNRDLSASHEILFCLDEAASLGVISDLLPCLRKYRKRKVRIFMLTQSLADIELTWGVKEKQAMMTNFKYKLILECSEPTEQEYWANLAGKEYKTTMSRTMGNNTSNTESEELLYKIDPEDFANLGNKLIFFYPGGYKKLYKNFYFK